MSLICCGIDLGRPIVQHNTSTSTTQHSSLPQATFLCTCYIQPPATHSLQKAGTSHPLPPSSLTLRGFPIPDRHSRQVVPPFPDRPTEGFLHFNVELGPMAAASMGEVRSFCGEGGFPPRSDPTRPDPARLDPTSWGSALFFVLDVFSSHIAQMRFPLQGR